MFLKDHEPHPFCGGSPRSQSLGEALGTKKFLLSVDGEEHKRLRKALNPAVTRKQMVEYVPKLETISRQHLDRWSENGAFDARAALKRLVYDQLGGVLTRIDASEYYEDVVRIFDTAVRVGVTRVWPAFMSNNPWARRSRRRTQELAAS